MTFLPIVERELRVRSRQRSTVRFRAGGAVAAIVLVTGLLGVTDLSAAGGSGSTLFGFLAALTFAYSVFEGARQTADCLSEEKRAGTLGLLFLTDLRGYDIVLGKLLATSLNSFYALLAVMPPLAIPLVLGGVTGGEFWRMALVLMATLALSVASGLLVSALAREASRAWIGTALLTFAVLPGPAAAFWFSFDARFQANPAAFWWALLPAPGLAGLFLVAASVALPRRWQETPVTLKPSRWQPGWMQRAHARRKAARDRLLALNPMLWLAARWEEQRVLLWIVVPTVAVAGTAALLNLPPSRGLVIGALLAAVGLHLALATWVGWLACQAGAEARRSGLLELVLTTPLSVSQIVEGHLEALQRLLRHPLMFLFVVEWGIAFWLGLGQAGGTGRFVVNPTLMLVMTAALTALAIADLHATATYGLWNGLRSARVGPALAQTVVFVLALPLVASLVCICAMPALLVVKDLWIINHARAQLLEHFRKVVAGEPLPAPGTAAKRTIKAQLRQLPRVLDP